MKHHYRMIRNSRTDHYFWEEIETGRMAIGDHSGDGMYDAPPSSPHQCEDGCLYVDTHRIAAEGLTVDIRKSHGGGLDVAQSAIPLLRPNGERSQTPAGWAELYWLAQKLNCVVHVITPAFSLSVPVSELEKVVAPKAEMASGYAYGEQGAWPEVT